MTVSIALLRGVNLGGRNAVPQRPLVERLERQLGVPVRHLLASGNLALRCAPDGLVELVTAAIRTATDLDIPVVVRTAEETSALLAGCPWPDADPVSVHLVLWDRDVDESALNEIAAADWDGDVFRPTRQGAWIRFARNSHTSRLTVARIEKQLGVIATARNLRTVRRLIELADVVASV